MLLNLICNLTFAKTLSKTLILTPQFPNTKSHPNSPKKADPIIPVPEHKLATSKPQFPSFELQAGQLMFWGFHITNKRSK